MIVQPLVIPPPPRRDKLLDARQVQHMIGGQPPPSLDWVYNNVPGKLKLSHRCVRWYENDVLEWLRGSQDAA